MSSKRAITISNLLLFVGNSFQHFPLSLNGFCCKRKVGLWLSLTHFNYLTRCFPDHFLYEMFFCVGGCRQETVFVAGLAIHAEIIIELWPLLAFFVASDHFWREKIGALKKWAEVAAVIKSKKFQNCCLFKCSKIAASRFSKKSKNLLFLFGGNFAPSAWRDLENFFAGWANVIS